MIRTGSAGPAFGTRGLDLGAPLGRQGLELLHELFDLGVHGGDGVRLAGGLLQDAVEDLHDQALLGPGQAVQALDLPGRSLSARAGGAPLRTAKRP